MSLPTSVKRLAVFDFDWTLIEADSDHWVMQQLNPELHNEQITEQAIIQWVDLQEKLLGKLHDMGVRRSQLEAALRGVPFTPEMIETLKFLKAQGTDICILSDANTVYIDVILKAYGIDHLIDRVLTNPAYYDETERLHVKRRRGTDLPHHGCPNPCAANLCKGQELDALMAVQNYDQVIYGGDGTNDYCAALHLRPQDVVLARSGLNLEKHIKANSSRVKATVKYWQSSKDVQGHVYEILSSFSNTSSIASDLSFNSSRTSLASTSSTAVDDQDLASIKLSSLKVYEASVATQPITVIH